MVPGQRALALDGAYPVPPAPANPPAPGPRPDGPARGVEAPPAIDARDPAQIAAYWNDRAHRVRWPAQFTALVTLARDAIATAPATLSPEQLGVRVVTRLCAGLMGQRIYFPHPDQVRRLLREAAIWQDFDGRNVTDLARRYRLSRQQVYKILRRQRRLRRSDAAPPVAGAAAPD